MNAWISDNQPVSQPYPLIMDSRWIGWACGTRNVVRSRRFTKSVLFSEPYRQGVDYIAADLDARDHYGDAGNPFEETDRQPYGERDVLGTEQL